MSQIKLVNLASSMLKFDDQKRRQYQAGLSELAELIGIPDDIRNLTYNIDLLVAIFKDLPKQLVSPAINDFLNTTHRLIYEHFKGRHDCYGQFKLHQPTQKSHIPKNQFPLYLAIDNLRRQPHNAKGLIIFCAILLKAAKNPISISVTKSILIDSDIRLLAQINEIGADSYLSRLEKTLEVINRSDSSDLDSAIKDTMISASAFFHGSISPAKTTEGTLSDDAPKPVREPSNRPHVKHETQQQSLTKISTRLFKNKTRSTTIRPIPIAEEVLPAESVFEDAPDIELHPIEKIDDQPTSFKRAKKAASEKRFRDAMTAQFLKSDRKRLTELELNRICEHVINELETQGGNQIVAFSVLLTLTTGAEPLFWCDWRCAPSQDAPYIDLELGTVVHYAQADGGFWKPDEIQQTKLIPVTDRVSLPLEERLLAYLKSHGLVQAQTLSEILGQTGEELDSACTEWIKKLFSDSSRWFTIKRVRYYLYQNIMTQTLDETLASHITVQPTYKIPASNSYTAVSQQRLYETFCNALPSIFNFAKPAQPNLLVGSKLQVRLDFLQSFLTERLQRYSDALAELSHRSTLTDIINAHNLFIDYAALVGFIHTSHRPQEDPWARPSDFLSNLHGVFITDKVTGVHNVTRLSYFGSHFRLLLENYHKHLKNLAYWLTHFDLPIEALRVASLLDEPNEDAFAPYFFYLEQSKSALSFVSITSNQLYKRMPEFGLPWNFGRHLRASYFQANNVPAEYINYDFGHVGIGQQPFGDYSALKPADIEAVIKPVVDKLSDELNIQVALPMPFKQSKLALPDKALLTPDHAVVLGFTKRQQKREKKAKSDHEIIRTIQQKYFSDENSEHLTQQDLEKALDVIYSRSPVHLVKTLNLFSRLCNGFIAKHNLELSPPSRLIELKNEVSTFTPDSGNLIARAIKIRHRLPNRLEQFNSGNTLKERLNDALAKLVLTLNFYSLLSCPKTLKPLLIAIKENDKFWFNNRLHINLRHKGRVYRMIPIDHLSAALVVQIKDLVRPNTPTKRFYLEEIEPVLFIMTEKLFNERLSVKKLAAISTELAKIELPGYLRAVQTGARLYASLDEAAWVRYHQGIRIQREPIKQEGTEKHRLPPRQKKLSQTILEYRQPSNIDLSQATRQRRRMTKVLREGIKFSREVNLEKLTVLLSEFRQENTLLITLLLCQWLMDSIARPGKRVSKLAYSTILTEFATVARHLTEAYATQHILDSSIADRVDEFQSIIFLEDSGQAERKAALLNFDDFLARQHKLKPIPPTTLEAQANDDPLKVDANFINEHEYSAVLRYLIQPFGEHNLELQCILALYYRLGMRPSEAFKFSFKDVQIGRKKEESYIINKFNNLGRLKNKASVRLIFFDPLTDEEFQQFREWFEEAKSKTPSLTQSIWAIDQREATDLISHALKTVTGDDDLSPRNLRHGVVSQLIKTMQLNNDDKDWQALSQRAFNTGLPTRRCIFHIARIVGHGGPSTTTFNYANLYEPLLDAAFPVPELNQYTFFSATLNKSPDLIRQWIRRSEYEDPSLAVIAQEFKRDKSFQELITHYKNPVEIPPLNNKLMSLHYDLINWHNPSEFKLLHRLRPSELEDLEDKIFKLALYKGFDPYQIAASKIRTEGLNLIPVDAEIEPKGATAFLENFFQLFNGITLEKLESICYKWSKLRTNFLFSTEEEASEFVNFFDELFSSPSKRSPSEHQQMLRLGIKKHSGSPIEPLGGEIHPRYAPSYLTLAFTSVDDDSDMNLFMSLGLKLLTVYLHLKKPSAPN